MTRYTVRESSDSFPNAYELFDAQHDARAVVLPAFGSNAIAFESGGRMIIELPQDRQAFVEGYADKTMYGTPLLFPPNRIRGGKFVFDGRSYELPLNEPPDNHLHGELGRRAWNVVEYGATEESGAYVRCRFDYADHPDLLATFPHPLRFTATHSLKDGILRLAIAVHNAGERQAPFAFGLHPYFAVPANGDGCSLHVPAVDEWPVTNQAFVSGLPQPTAFSAAIAGDGIDIGAYPPAGCNMLTLQADDRVSAIEVKAAGYRICYRVDRQFPYLLLFKPPWSSAFSLEPYTYVTDAFNLPYPAEQTGARGIAPGETLELRTEVWMETV
ncbi:MAG: aldose 1-epimerase [Paenibacillaceae bacterium]|nr:aldose 1-epimerase [Paenibacillaceae bacterium]